MDEPSPPSKRTTLKSAPLPSAPSPQELAEHFPQLKIIELLGQGGMGYVYKARQVALDRLIALKLLPGHIGKDQSFAERFAREARALGRLNHPSIVTIHDSGKTGGMYFFIMEYVDGLNLRQVLERSEGRVAPDEAFRIVGSVCEALEYAHSEGIVHRDIKTALAVALGERGPTPGSTPPAEALTPPTPPLTPPTPPTPLPPLTPPPPLAPAPPSAPAAAPVPAPAPPRVPTTPQPAVVDAYQLVRRPGSFLFVAGVITLLVFAPQTIYGVLGAILSFPDPPQVVQILTDGFATAVACLAIFASQRMRRLESRGLVMTACVASLLAVSPCMIPIMIPAGIWGLYVVTRPEVARAFALRRARRADRESLSAE